MRMKSRLVQIGNSRGVRLSKAVLDHAALSEDVEIIAEPGVIQIRSATRPRAGWAEAAAGVDPSPLLDGPTGSTFDDSEWTW